ncbi:MAG TPA: phytanoyl-CoA dioxygenase family protein [Candidatus Saccharimonadales bacterium]|nr:phytanoyl-CoA dioxygenase family protein [Candidatus Saccharimonadales bacterium]
MTTDPGFSIAPSVLSAAETTELGRELSQLAHRSRAGVRHLMSCQAVAQVAHTKNLLALASEALGRPAVPFRATLFDKSPRSNWLVVWHQDTALPLQARFDAPGWGPWSLKENIIYAHAPADALARVVALRLHLDPSTSENGPLRIIPGSHLLGLLSDDEIANLVKAMPAEECVVPAGGVLVMRPLHVHSSSKSTSAEPRRVLHIEYTDSFNLGSGIELAIA